LIFTKRGPIEIHFKLSHYVSLALTIVVGVSSIVYYSIVGISSAIDVAQKDIITEASANLPTSVKEDKSNNIESNSVLNEINIDETKSNDNKIGIETNISLPEQTNEINFNAKVIPNSKNLIKDKIHSNKLDEPKSKSPINSKIAANAKILSNKLDENVFEEKDSNHDVNNKNIDNDNAFYISPPKLDERASNFRFISSLDNELSNLEKVFDKLDLELKDNRIQKVRNLINKELDYKEDAEKFLIAFRKRLDLLAIYKNALEFIPLKPPMEHYYVTSKYGKRKHPVTKKWRFHHGIDLAGTWQENIRVSADGVVTFAGYHGSFGKVIRIRHNYGIKTTYGHLAKILVKKGQIVSEGQVVGKMGRTGRVDGAHLHYEISVNGKSKDPATYFSIGRKLLSRNSLKSIADIN
jgi:murein DD-endopeptidase MepM/ murein hydrolase activator NlpD